MAGYKKAAIAAGALWAAICMGSCAEGDKTANQQAAKHADIEESQDIDAGNKKNMADDSETPSDQIDIYHDVLAEYKDMVRNDFYTDLRGTDAYDGSFGEHIGLEIRLNKQDVYYALYDIDGNGRMELLIAGSERGVTDPVFSPWNYDLYGYDGTKVVSIFPEMEFGYRTNFELYGNGVIKVFYTGSAAEYGVDFYKIGSDGFTPVLVDSFTAIGHLEGEKPVFVYAQNGTAITEDTYNASIQSYEVSLDTQLEWIQIQ